MRAQAAVSVGFLRFSPGTARQVPRRSSGSGRVPEAGRLQPGFVKGLDETNAQWLKADLLTFWFSNVGVYLVMASNG